MPGLNKPAREQLPHEWEARSALRYGSQHQGYFETRGHAQRFALDEIASSGEVGRIESESETTRTVYYSIFPEED